MHRGYALPGAVVLSLAALLGSLTRPAAAPPPPEPGSITTVAGNGKIGFSGDGGPAIQASLNSPYNLVVDGTGNLFIADGFNNRVRKVSTDGTITTVAGGGTKAPAAAEGGLATEARLGAVSGLALDAESNLFIGDVDSSRIWRVSPEGLITTAAGNGRRGFSGDGGPALQAMLNAPLGLAMDRAGSLLIVDTLNNRVRKVSHDGVITTVAGGGSPADGLGDGGPATQARLKLPFNVALDRTGDLFITDFQNHRVRMVRPDGVILTVAGGGSPADGLGDGGLATQASLDGPFGVAVDAAGNLFIADNRHNRVRKVGPVGIITTVVGTGKAGFSGDEGPATEARLHGPECLAVDRAGNLFIGDTVQQSPDGSNELIFNNRIREVFAVAAQQ